jgi:hypothetical protein
MTCAVDAVVGETLVEPEFTTEDTFTLTGVVLVPGKLVEADERTVVVDDETEGTVTMLMLVLSCCSASDVRLVTYEKVTGVVITSFSAPGDCDAVCRSGITGVTRLSPFFLSLVSSILSVKAGDDSGVNVVGDESLVTVIVAAAVVVIDVAVVGVDVFCPSSSFSKLISFSES